MLTSTLKSCASEVMRSLGRGHSESVYHKSLITLLNARRIPHRSEVICPILFMGECVGVGRADLIVDNVVVEIKAFASSPHSVSPQLRKYLVSMHQANGAREYHGLVLNFNTRTGIVDSHDELYPAVRARPEPVIKAEKPRSPDPVTPSPEPSADGGAGSLDLPSCSGAGRLDLPSYSSASSSASSSNDDAKSSSSVEISGVEAPPPPTVIDLDSVIEPLRYKPYERPDGRPLRATRAPDFLRVPSKNVLKY